ncbi:MAG: (d)CMP kinase [Lachnospiraceae bacterium]|nr:(d)CMP kinase [Lachnospiraceae bacterium]
MNIAIDGPAGAGKSTVAKRVAGELGMIYVDTGALYRAIALYLLNHAIDGDDEQAVEAALKGIRIEMKHDAEGQHILLNGDDVTGNIRTEAVGNMASKTSAYGAVRAKLLSLQQDIAKENDVVMDGRDIGTTVLPGAEVKIFLTASVEVRAKRRYDELTAKGETCDFDRIAADIAARDEQDRTRALSPLKQAEDAYLLDSSGFTIDEVVAEIIARTKAA